MSQIEINLGITLTDSDLNAAVLALVARAPLTLDNTTDAKIPMIAITTKSSINAKPFLNFFHFK